jgi:hypothetical protein
MRPRRRKEREREGQHHGSGEWARIWNHACCAGDTRGVPKRRRRRTSLSARQPSCLANQLGSGNASLDPFMTGDPFEDLFTRRPGYFPLQDSLDELGQRLAPFLGSPYELPMQPIGDIPYLNHLRHALHMLAHVQSMCRRHHPTATPPLRASDAPIRTPVAGSMSTAWTSAMVSSSEKPGLARKTCPIFSRAARVSGWRS